MRVPQKTLIIQLFSILKMSFIYDYGKYRGNVNRKGLFALFALIFIIVKFKVFV